MATGTSCNLNFIKYIKILKLGNNINTSTLSKELLLWRANSYVQLNVISSKMKNVHMYSGCNWT